MCYDTIISHKFSILSLNKMSPRCHNTSPEKQNYLYHFHRSLSIVIVNEARDVNTARANHHRFNRQSTAPSPQHTTYLFLWSTKGAQNDQRVPTEEGQKNTLLSRVKLPPDDSVAHAWSRKSRGWIQSEAALSDQEEHRNVEKRNKWNVDSLKSSSNSSQCFTGKLAWDHFEVKFTEGYLVNKTFHPCSPSWIWNHPTLSISDYEPRNELPTRSGMGL